MPAIRVRLNEGGRIVIPAEFRRELGLEEGDVLMIERDGDGLQIRSALAALERVAAYVQAHLPPGTGSLVDELFADRREEFAREEAETAEMLKADARDVA